MPQSLHHRRGESSDAARLLRALDAAIARADHIHARVGWPHGPQVADPRTGSGLRWTERFERWWDRIVEARAAEGREFLTINPEFGPPPYQPTDPDGKPLADIWDICLWMTQRFRERWSGRLAPGVCQGSLGEEDFA